MTAKANMYESKTNSLIGTIFFQDFKWGMKVIVELKNVPPGFHGLHIHEFGGNGKNKDCDSMGKHFNPTAQDHGGREGIHRHIGDFGNVYANDQGIVSTSFFVFDTFLYCDTEKLQYTLIGKGIVLHENMDDLGKTNIGESKSNGNSGKRIACGKIRQF